MKACNDCGDLKDLSEFYRDAKLSDGHRNCCKLCVRVRSAQWKAEHPEQHREYRREWSKRPNAKAATNARARKYRNADRDAALARYGTKCAYCGSTDQLQIDHINDDGREHRQGDLEAVTIHRWLRKHGYPEGFQTLCQSCNQRKARLARSWAPRAYKSRWLAQARANLGITVR
jgi:5-methylcytosine-specific restriction endonuclease McrA